MKSAGVIGAGAWGTALAQICAVAGLEVRLYGRNPGLMEAIRADRQNGVYLPGVTLHDRVDLCARLGDLADCELLLNATPAQHLRENLLSLAPFARANRPMVICAKGVERGTGKLMSQVMAQCLPDMVPAVLSGPSFAAEVARGLPTAVTLACADADLGLVIAEAIATPAFRPYLSDDLIGAEVGGAVKNVLAIACGIVEGRGLGRSAHAALITRGFAEMTRLAVAMGGHAETVAGLCGLGDLVLTCSSPQSRNMSLGLALGRGQSVQQALSGKVTVAEGAASAPGLYDLARSCGVDMPISSAVAAILAGGLGIDDAINGLLSRPLKLET